MKRLRSAVPSWRRAIKDSDLPANAKHVALNLSIYFSEAGDSAYPSLETQVDDVGRSKRVVIDALRLLEDEGWIVRDVSLGGRGRRTTYSATLPETVSQVHRSEGAGGGAEAAGEGAREAVRATLAPAASEALVEARADAETVQPQHRLSGRETVQPAHVNGAASARKQCRDDTRSVKDRETDQQQQGSPPPDHAAAARTLDERLRAVGVGTQWRLRALNDPDRAQAWLELARAAADTNPAGYWRVGFESGEWPSPRGSEARAIRAGESRWAWVEQSWQFDVEDAHTIVDDWRDLDDAERARLHERVDEVRAEHDAAAAREAEVA